MQIQLTINQDDINKLGKTITKVFDSISKDPAIKAQLVNYVFAVMQDTKPANAKSRKKTKRAKP